MNKETTGEFISVKPAFDTSLGRCPGQVSRHTVSTFQFRERVSNHSNFGAIARFRMQRVYGGAAALVKSLPSISYFH